jgi:hypothetical protein
MVSQEKIEQPLPAPSEPSDVLHLQRTIDSLEKENAWLKERLARISETRPTFKVIPGLTDAPHTGA